MFRHKDDDQVVICVVEDRRVIFYIVQLAGLACCAHAIRELCRNFVPSCLSTEQGEHVGGMRSQGSSIFGGDFVSIVFGGSDILCHLFTLQVRFRGLLVCVPVFRYFLQISVPVHHLQKLSAIFH